MTFSELKELDDMQLTEKMFEFRKDLMKLRINLKTGQNVKPHLFKQIKKNIAQIKTLLKQRTMENKA